MGKMRAGGGYAAVADAGSSVQRPAKRAVPVGHPASQTAARTWGHVDLLNFAFTRVFNLC